MIKLCLIKFKNSSQDNILKFFEANEKTAQTEGRNNRL